jgi:hypothetical protein
MRNISRCVRSRRYLWSSSRTKIAELRQFLRFFKEFGRIHTASRLYGGARGIRTLRTVYEKNPKKRSNGDARTLSPIRFEGRNRRIAPISRNFRSTPRGFLCDSNCLVERVEIELSIEFLEPARARTSGTCIPFSNNNIQSENRRWAHVSETSRISYLENGEHLAIARPNEIQMCAVFPTSKRLAETASLPIGQ